MYMYVRRVFANATAHQLFRHVIKHAPQTSGFGGILSGTNSYLYNM